MSVIYKGNILKDLFSPSTLTQMHPDAIYDVIKGIYDTSKVLIDGTSFQMRRMSGDSDEFYLFCY